MGGVQNSAVNAGASWQHFYRVTGTTALQTVQVQLRDPSGTATIDDLQIIAFKLPAGADFQFVENETTQAVTASVWASYQSLTFTPTSVGDYLIIAVANGHEFPGGSTIGIRLQDPAASHWPAATAYYANPRDPWQSFFLARVQNLAVSSQTYQIQANGSATGGSEIRNTRIMAFRTDVFDSVQSVENTAESSTTSTTPVVKSVLTTTAPPAARDYIVIQSLGLRAASSSTDQRRAGFEEDDVVQTSYGHVINNSEYTTSFGTFDALATSSSVKYENTFSTSNALFTVYAKESVIHVLRLPAQAADSVDITVSVHHTNASGGDPQLITSASTTIDATTADPLALSLGSGAAQTFTSADPRYLRVLINVTAVNNGGSFTLDYDGACASSLCSSLDTPVVTVPEYGLIFGAFAILIPVTMGSLWHRRRLAKRARVAHDPLAHSQRTNRRDLGEIQEAAN